MCAKGLVHDDKTKQMQVDAVFHSTAFADKYKLPLVGTKARTEPPAEFCLGETIDSNCEPADLSILAITDTTMEDASTFKSQQLVYVRYQRLVRCVCMCVCVCVCMCVCVCVCVCLCVCVCVWRLFLCMGVCVYIYTIPPAHIH
jgi:hypothetical protein